MPSTGTDRVKESMSLNQKGKRTMAKELDRKCSNGRSVTSKGSWSYEVVKIRLAEEIRKALFSGTCGEKCQEVEDKVGEQGDAFPKNAFPDILNSGPNWADISQAESDQDELRIGVFGRNIEELFGHS